MATYTTLAQAQAHLRLSSEGSPDAFEDDVDLKLTQAEAMVLTYLKGSAPTSSDEESMVQAATLKVLGNLWRFRGDEEKPSGAGLTPDVMLMLGPLRDPSLA